MTAPNDWHIKKCLRIILAILFSLLGLIGMESLGFNIPLIREIVGFIFLTFVPGILIMRTLRIHNLSIVENLLYSVALSIAFIYFTGLFANFVLPLMGVSKPISLLPITAVLTIFTFILGLLAYKRDKAFSPLPGNLSFKEIPFSFYLLLLMLPLLAVLGTQLVNAYQNNIVLLFLLGLIACIIGVISFGGYLSDKTYPLAIIIIAISLLLHQSLISPTIYGSDISIEYYLQHLVMQNGIWDWFISNNYNTCLSIVILAPIYFLIMSVDGIWLFKILYPILFSLAPLALFQALRKQIGAERSFFAVFFFMAIPTVVPVLIGHARQEIAEIFFAMLILLIVDNKLNYFQKSVLGMIFYISLVFSHYALTYISIIIFGAGYVLLLLFKHQRLLILQQKMPHLFGFMTNMNQDSRDMRIHPVLNTIPILLLLVVTVSWHIYITTGSMFNDIVTIGKTVYTGLAEFFLPGVRESMVTTGLGGGFLQAPILSKVYRVLQYMTQLFIVVGFLAVFFKNKPVKLRLEFIALSTINFLIIFACIIIPLFGAQLGFERFYHIASFFLAPFCILGGEVIWSGVVKILQRVNLSIKTSGYFPTLNLVVLIPYFLFTSGFVYAFSNQQASIALGPYKADYYALYNTQEVNAASWFWNKVPHNNAIYADATGGLLLNQRHFGKSYRIPASGRVPDDAYIFLRTWNIRYKEILVPAFQGVNHVYVPVNLKNRPQLAERIDESKLIYTNGGARVLAQMEHD